MSCVPLTFRLIAGALVCCCVYGDAQTHAPSCQSRVLRIVEDAKLQVVSGDKDRASQLLDQADRECGSSYAVLKAISEAYEQMGSLLLADAYRKNANRYVSQDSSAKVTAGANSPPAATAREKGFVRAKYALVVGVGEFEEKDIPSLKYTAKDANDFAAALLDPNAGRFLRENVTVLTDKNATTTAIRNALADIARKALKEDLVVLYFSTHGSDPSADHSKSASGYLVTYDTDARHLYGTAYGMDELANFLKQKMSAGRIVTFLDTCYSGDTTRHMKDELSGKGLEVEDAIPERSIGAIAQGVGSVVITSSSNNEMSWESEEKHNSFFTLSLMEAMRNRSGLSTILQLFTDIQREVPTAVRDYTKGKTKDREARTQTPEIYPKNDVPDIVIGTPTR